MSQQDLYLVHQLILYISLEEVNELYHTLVGLYCVSVFKQRALFVSRVKIPLWIIFVKNEETSLKLSAGLKW